MSIAMSMMRCIDELGLKSQGLIRIERKLRRILNGKGYTCYVMINTSRVKDIACLWRIECDCDMIVMWLWY